MIESMTIRVFGITGTNGKTTASCMLRDILMTAGFPCGLIGTISHQVGDEKYIPKNTTPGAELLKELFQKMTERKISHCVMEVSSHGLHQGRVDGVVFDYGGFTNLSQDHLDYHKTMEDYYQTKKTLFYRCAKGSAINLDDAYGARLFQELNRDGVEGVKSFSLHETKADFYGKIKQQTIQETVLAVENQGSPLGELIIPLGGEHFASDGLLAVSLALMAGIEFAVIREALEKIQPIPGRMEQIGSPEDTLGIVDYAHTPDGLEKLLQTVRSFARGRIICVFGCGGFRDKDKRPLMGAIAGRLADYCIITNDNPRGEPAENIAQAIEEGIHPTGCAYSIVLDRYQAIQRAVLLATKWDTIVVAGKGHEKYQLIGEEYRPFDDSVTLTKLLEKKYEKTYDRAIERGNKG